MLGKNSTTRRYAALSVFALLVIILTACAPAATPAPTPDLDKILQDAMPTYTPPDGYTLIKTLHLGESCDTPGGHHITVETTPPTTIPGVHTFEMPSVETIDGFDFVKYSDRVEVYAPSGEDCNK
jgi:hypothetical protein